MRFLVLGAVTLLFLPVHAFSQAEEAILKSRDLVETFDLQPSEAERVATEAQRYIREIGGPDAYREVLADRGPGSDPSSIAQAGGFLILEGAVRLGKSATDFLATLRLNWIRRFGCKAVVSGSSGGRWRLMASLDSTELANLMDFQVETTRAVIDQAGDPPEFGRNRLVQAWRAFHAQLPSDEQNRFVDFLDAPMQSQEERCWFQTRLWELLPELPEEDSRIILWQIATRRF